MISPLFGEYRGIEQNPLDYRAIPKNASKSAMASGSENRGGPYRTRIRGLPSPLLRWAMEVDNFNTLVYDPVISKHLTQDTNKKVKPSDLISEDFRNEIRSFILSDGGESLEFANYYSFDDTGKKHVVDYLQKLLRSIIRREYVRIVDIKNQEASSERHARKTPRVTAGMTNIQMTKLYSNGRGQFMSDKNKWLNSNFGI